LLKHEEGAPCYQPSLVSELTATPPQPERRACPPRPARVEGQRNPALPSGQKARPRPCLGEGCVEPRAVPGRGQQAQGGPRRGRPDAEAVVAEGGRQARLYTGLVYFQEQAVNL